MKGRGPVVQLDRSQKARMITAIIEDYLRRPVAGYRTLDIGCGNGGISEYFARSNDHYAVDIVISHHVIEHVRDQGLHLDEMHRVLKAEGVAYLATPNKSSPLMEGHVGNDKVLRYREMGPLFGRHGFESHEYGMRVVREPDRFHGEVHFWRFLPEATLKLLRPLFPSHMFVMTKAAGRS